MSILSDFEDRLGGAVEGMFGAVFRSPVQPAELARASSKEMTRSRKLGVDKLYVANVYFVFISPRDADTLGGLIPTLEGELETYLLAFSRERDFALATRPVVRFTTDDRLRLGKFDVIGEQMSVGDIYEELGSVPGVTDDLEVEPVEQMIEPEGLGGSASTPAPEPAMVSPAVVEPFVPSEPVWAEPGAGAPVAYAPEPALDAGVAAVGLEPAMPVDAGRTPPPVMPMPITPMPTPDVGPVLPVEPAAPVGTPVMVRRASLAAPGLGKLTLEPGKTYVMGRQQACDVCVEDANVSRRHAELFRDGENWVVRDLGSTNGTMVNGRSISSHTLRDGDQITLGVSALRFCEVSRMERQ